MVAKQAIRRWQSTSRTSPAFHPVTRTDLVIVTTNSEAEISPSLLERARKIAAEHSKLSGANAENYDMATAKRIGELGPVTAALKEYEAARDVQHLQHLPAKPPTNT